MAELKTYRAKRDSKRTPEPVPRSDKPGQRKRKQAGKAAGATGWLVKPFNPERLLATINKVLG